MNNLSAPPVAIDNLTITKNASNQIQALNHLSNVVFLFTTGNAETQASGVNGLCISTAIEGTTGEIKFAYWAVLDDIFKTIVKSKFKKIAGISTITVYADLWQSGTTTSNNAEFKISVGTVTQTVAGSDIRRTPEWLAPIVLDVSGLVNGTLYDVIAQIRQNNGGGRQAYCSTIIGIAS